MLPVLLYDGMVEQRRVNWNEVPDTRVTGEYDVTGNVEGVPFAAHAKICVVEELPEAENLLLSMSAGEDGLARWNVEKSEDAVAVQLFPEFVDPFPAPPVNAVRVEAPKNFTFFDLPDGKGTGGRNVYIICCLSGNRYNKMWMCGCSSIRKREKKRL